MNIITHKIIKNKQLQKYKKDTWISRGTTLWCDNKSFSLCLSWNSHRQASTILHGWVAGGWENKKHAIRTNVRISIFLSERRVPFLRLNHQHQTWSSGLLNLSASDMAFSRKFMSQPTLKMKITFCKRYHTIYDKAIVDLWINFISTFIFIKKWAFKACHYE